LYQDVKVRTIVLAVLFLGLFIDLTFIQLHRAGIEQFNIEVENSYSEYYENLKELFIVIMAGSLFLRKKEALYGCWAAMLTYIFLDDTFQIHERFGEFISGLATINAPFGLRARDLGELAVTGVVGTGFVASLIASYKRSSREARLVSFALLGLLSCLFLFGVVVDMVHIIVRSEVWKWRLGIIEDGSEMFVISSIMTFVLWRLLKTRRNEWTGVRLHNPVLRATEQ
jgi:hypothetical protein